MSRAVDGALGSVNKLMSGVGGVSSALGELSKQGRDPTTGFEHEMIKNNVSLNRMGAGLGKTGKQLKDFNQKSQGLALTMNRSAEEAGSAVGQFDRMREASTKAGIDSEKTMLKLQDATGVNAQVFADASLQMMKMQGMSKEAGQAIFDAMTEAGKATGDVPGALQETEKRMALLQRRSALLAQGFKGIGVEEFSKQIDQTTADMQRITKVSAATARAFSHGLAESIQNVGEDFKKLTVGIGTDIPEGLKGLALTTGDVKTAFDTMEDGPEGFMKTMRNMTKSMGGDKEKIGQLMTWINARTGQAFGPERAAEIVNMLAASTEETDKNAKSVKDATGALKKYGDEAFKTGRTAAEAMALQEETFIAGIRAISPITQEWLKGNQEGFTALGAEIKHLAATKGPVGELTKSFINLSQKGLVGLLPENLQKHGVAVGVLGEQIGKTLSGILNPLNLVESGLVLFGAKMLDVFEKQPKKWGFGKRFRAAFESVTNDVVEYLGELPQRIARGLNSVTKEIANFFTGGGGKSFWGKQIGRWWDAILKFFTDMKPLVARLKKFASEFWAGFTATMSSDPEKQSLGEKAGRWLGEIWEGAKAWFDNSVWQPIKKFAKEFWEGLTTALDPEKQAAAVASYEPTTGGLIGKWFGEVLVSAQKYWNAEIVPAGKKLWDDFAAAFEGKGDPTTTGGKIGIFLSDAFDTAFQKLADNLPSILWKIVKALGKGVFNIAGAIGDVIVGNKPGSTTFDSAAYAFGGDSAPSPSSRAAATSTALSSSSNPISAIHQLQSTTEEAAKEQRQRDLEQKQREEEMLYYQRMEARRRGEPAFTSAGESSGGGQSRMSAYKASSPADKKSATYTKPVKGGA